MPHFIKCAPDGTIIAEGYTTDADVEAMRQRDPDVTPVADEEADYGELGRSARVTLGFSGFGIGNESTVWLSTLRPGWSWQRNIKPTVEFEMPKTVARGFQDAGEGGMTLA